jgi:hypothetical protein
VTDTHDHPPGDRGHASARLHASETGGSHLAHWPPPQRGREVKPVQVKHPHQPSEPDPHAKPHGLGLTRSAFKDDDE